MGKYRFRKGGMLLKILMEKYTSLIIIPEKLLGSIPGIGKFNYIYFITLHMPIFLFQNYIH
ncbi:GSCOCG00003241001-RA-CDS [Cotesia congregata]|nr:GSCOCG00003241001-RA-CDS [Cotesia congregata]